MIDVDRALWLLMGKDPGLQPWLGDIRMHLDRCNATRWQLAGDGSLSEFANGHHYFGFHRTDTGWVFREWLPGADAAWLMGDFNAWRRYDCPLTPVGNGVWEVALGGRDVLRHGQFVKLVVGRQGASFERIPAYIRRCALDMSAGMLCSQLWMPDAPFQWTDADYCGVQRPEAPMIYEAHVGMAQEHAGIGSYREFADETLSWIKYAGYNTVLLNAIQEQADYASMGASVTNYFAPSHRFGTPEDLKYLVNKAHEMGLSVLMDVEYAWASPNVGESLNGQDGTGNQYFLTGGRGWHAQSNGRVFDYSKPQTLHFLLSNLKYWMEEYHFDGFRFDGADSMLYENHGQCTFEGRGAYFSTNTNVDGRVFMMLANELVHGLNEKAMTLAADRTGFPGLCLPLEYGGVGFDYRLDTGIANYWAELASGVRQEDWDVRALWRALTAGRPGEMRVGFSETREQSLMFRLAGAEMYAGMDKGYHSVHMDWAVDMHKVIRLLTCSLSGNGFLNFIGNEFGHPDWVELPSERNGWDARYARRQWSLVRNWNDKYDWLANFDRGMTFLFNRYGIHHSGEPECLSIDAEKMLVLFARGGLLFAFNLHPAKGWERVFISARATGPGGYRAVFTTDEWPFGGGERVSKETTCLTVDTELGNGILIDLPCRFGAVFEKVE